MKASVKRAWIKALRSGKYEQGTSWLAQQFANGAREYCCLGVLCAVTGQLYTVRTETESKIQFLDFGQTDSENDAEEVVPTHTAFVLGLPSRNPKLPIDVLRPTHADHRYTLAQLNDDGLTFDQIADLIEYFIPVDGMGEELHDVTSEQSTQRSAQEVHKPQLSDDLSGSY